MKDMREYVKKCILEKAYFDRERYKDSLLSFQHSQIAFFFDFRNILFEKAFLEAVASLFWKVLGEGSQIQIGGLESASLPIITACVMKEENASGFYIRKSRKKKGESKQIEGIVTDLPIVLVDDVLNTGASFEKQVHILEKEGKRVYAIFAIVRFFDDSAYSFFTERGIKIYSLFSLEDLALKASRGQQKKTLDRMWYFGPVKPHFPLVEKRSQPVLFGEFLYATSDSGYIWCIDTGTGKVLWSKLLMWRVRKKKATFTDLLLHGDRLYVGSINGSLYVLDLKGKILYKESFGERITSAPVIKGDILCCAVKVGGPLYRSAIIGYSLSRREIVWERQVAGAVSGNFTQVSDSLIFQGSDGVVHCLQVNSGKTMWSQKVDGVEDAGSVYDEERGVLFSTQKGLLVSLSVLSGKMRFEIPVAEWLHATPCVVGSRAYVTSLDKYIYCIDLEKKTIVWERETEGRIFSSPVVQKNRVYVGSNDGMLYICNSETGAIHASQIVSERITNPVLFKDNLVFVTTFANEIYCFKDVLS
ncbi:PQQ-binding-like beta-propeller repeat protein [Patescibacteria group bacterium]|nr:PQQ-binding-like beta-propeller repeat protein [Patescibacteria group bacterium]